MISNSLIISRQRDDDVFNKGKGKKGKGKPKAKTKELIFQGEAKGS